MAATPHRPNILWVCTDRQRWDTLGCYGNRFVTTPNLDRLASEGVRFEQAWCQNPICSPSRASFLTGRYPRTTRVNRNGQRLPDDEKLISRLLADHGYVCGHAGKLHLAPSAPPLAHWCEQRGDDGYSAFDWSMHPPDKPVSPYTAWLVEHGIDFRREPVESSKYVSFGMDEKTSNTAWVTQRAINFLTVSAPLDQPWFFTLNINSPHDPIDPPRRFLEPYLQRLDDIPLPTFDPAELTQKPPFLSNCHRLGAYGNPGGFAYEPMTPRDHRLIRAGYWALVDHIDYQVGRVLDALRRTGQLDRTIVIFMSDHGEMLGDHGCYFQGPYFYQQMMRVPLLMRLPAGLPRSLSVSAMVELVDLAPTLMHAARLEPHEGMQGRSLWPILTGDVPANRHRDSVYFEYYQAIPGGHRSLGATDIVGLPNRYLNDADHRHQQGGGYLTGVRTGRYALTAVHGLPPSQGTIDGELYDLETDPTETRNRWGNPAYVSVQATMLKLLCDRMAQTIDPLPPTRAAY